MFARSELLMLTASLAVLVGCATTDQGTRTVGERPQELNSTEASLWYRMDEAEENLRSSGRVIDDPALTGYVDALVCRIAGEFCPDVRVYVVNNPGFNAMMAPNGMMVINSGLLLRAESEDELGFVIGHELVHYLENHALEQHAAARNANITAAVVGSVLSIGVAAATGGVPGQGYSGSGASIATALAYGGAYAYSRERESEADRMGLQLASAAGLDPKAGPKIWNDLLNELEASDDNRRAARANRGGMFRTHPVIQARIEALEEEAASMQGEPADSTAFRAAVAPFINDWLDAEIALRDYGSTLQLIERRIAAGGHEGVFLAAKARVLGMRDDEGDFDRALETYEAAAAYADMPAQAYRDLGELNRRAGRSAEAAEAFTTYLQRVPDARDALLVERYIQTLMGESE